MAVNKLEQIQQNEECRDERLNEIMNYIQEHYLTVTLDDLAEKLHLSKPYLSKYIKEKSGNTFGEIVKISIHSKHLPAMSNRSFCQNTVFLFKMTFCNPEKRHIVDIMLLKYLVN